MTSKQRRRLSLINRLSEMGRLGWHLFTAEDWQPLERELHSLDSTEARSITRRS